MSSQFTFAVFSRDGNFETFATENEAIVYARQSQGMVQKIPNAYLSQRCETIKNSLSRNYPPVLPQTPEPWPGLFYFIKQAVTKND